MFFWNSCFFYDPTDVGNLISSSSAFSISSLNIWKFSVHGLLKPGFENFEHYFTSMWDECNFAVVWACFGIAFLWDWNENWPFPVLQPLLEESEVAQSCLTPCNPMNCSPPGSSIHGIFQARILEWVAPPFSRGSSWTRDQTWVSHLSGRFFTIWTTKPIPNVTCYVIPLTWHPWNYKTVDLENGLVAFMNSGGLGVKGGGCAYEGATPGILCKCSASWPSLANVDLLMCC